MSGPGTHSDFLVDLDREKKKSDPEAVFISAIASLRRPLDGHAHLEFELRRLKLANGPAALNALINAIGAVFARYCQRRRRVHLKP